MNRMTRYTIVAAIWLSGVIGGAAPAPASSGTSSAVAPAPAVRAAFIDTPTTTALAPATPTPAAPFHGEAHGGFDPEKFGTITSSTLPQENGVPIVARVNGRAVPFSEFEIQARVAGAEYMMSYPDRQASIYSAVAIPVMDALVLQELHREYAEANHLLPSAENVRRHQQGFHRQGAVRIQQSLKLLTDEQELALARDSLINENVAKFVGDRATSTPPTLEEITSYTLLFKPTTSPVELIRARHIVVRATAGASDFAVNDARAKTEEIRQRLRDGFAFEAAARQYSQDRFTAYLGGNLGYFARGTMFAEFEDAAFALQPGEISEIIRTPVGFHIVQVTERHPDDLLRQVDQHRRAIALHQWKEQLLKSAKVENYLTGQ